MVMPTSGRSQDRNLSPVSFNSCALKKRIRGPPLRQSGRKPDHPYKPPPRRTLNIVGYAFDPLGPNYWWLSLFLIKRTARDRYLRVVQQQQHRTGAFSAPEPLYYTKYSNSACIAQRKSAGTPTSSDQLNWQCPLHCRHRPNERMVILSRRSWDQNSL